MHSEWMLMFLICRSAPYDPRNRSSKNLENKRIWNGSKSLSTPSNKLMKSRSNNNSIPECANNLNRSDILAMYHVMWIRLCHYAHMIMISMYVCMSSDHCWPIYLLKAAFQHNKKTAYAHIHNKENIFRSFFVCVCARENKYPVLQHRINLFHFSLYRLFCLCALLFQNV